MNPRVKAENDELERLRLALAAETELRASLERRLDIRLRYEQALWRCSSLLLSDAAPDDALPRALDILRESAGVCRVYIFENFEDPERGLATRQTFEARAPGVLSEQDNPDLQHFVFQERGFGRWVEHLSAGRPIQGFVEDFPIHERAMLNPQGIRSIFVLPVMVGGRWHGFVGFDDTRARRVFKDDDQRFLATAAEMIGAFLQRVSASRELREREMRLRGFVENMPVLVMARGEDGRMAFWNRECEHVTGYAANEIVGNPDAPSFLFPNARERGRLFGGGECQDQDFRHLEASLKTKDGGMRVVSWSKISCQVTVPGWESWAIGLDISDRVQVENLVIRAKAEWERTFDSVPDMIVIMDNSLVIQRLNRAAAQALNSHPREIVGRHLRQMLDDGTDGSGDVFTRIRFMAHSEDPEVQELHIRRLGGHFLVTVCPYILDDGERVGSILVAHDISRWKLLEDQLRQAQKMEALGTLAGGIAHDFNNILGAIMGYTEMMLDDAAPGSPGLRMLNEIFKACERARLLIEQILAFSRQDRQDPRPLRLTPLIKETLRFLRGTLPSNVTIHQHLLTKADVVVADPTQLHQLLMNLCVNAAQAIGEAPGELEISLVDSYLIDEDMPGFGQLPPGPYIRLGVRDTGPGIPPEIRERIFDPFFTTKKPGEGTGMGLAVVHGIARKLGGTVILHSQPGEGATFYIYLPRQDRLHDEDHVLDVTPPFGSERVLLVDDEAPLLDIGREILQQLGYTVTTFGVSLKALEHFAEHPGDFDLAIVDQAMPSLTGVELIERMREIRADLPVVLCTGFSEAMAFEKARQLGVKRVLIKPVLRRDLARAIREALDGDAEMTTATPHELPS